MAITVLDTHQTVKDLTAAGFSDVQAEALTEALRQAQQIDVSSLAGKAEIAELRVDAADIHKQMATKIDLIELRREMAEMKVELIKWLIGIGFAQVATIVAVLELFPGH